MTGVQTCALPILDEIQVNTDGRRQVDSGGNQDKPNAEVSEELDLDSSKDNSAPRLFTLNKTPKPSFRASLLPSIELSNTLAKKKLYYMIIPTKEARLKKKINSDVGEQNVVTEKRIKK